MNQLRVSCVIAWIGERGIGHAKRFLRVRVGAEEFEIFGIRYSRAMEAKWRGIRGVVCGFVVQKDAGFPRRISQSKASAAVGTVGRKRVEGVLSGVGFIESGPNEVIAQRRISENVR